MTHALAAAVLTALFASCAVRVELTSAERALYASALEPAKEVPARVALVLEAASGGQVSEMHAIVDGDRALLVGLDPLGVSMKAILREDLLWMKARGKDGKEFVARYEGDDARTPADVVGSVLAALRMLRPFSAGPLPITGASSAYLTGEHLVAEAKCPGGLVERRTFRRADLVCVRREILRGGQSLAAAIPEPGRDSLRLVLPGLATTLDLRVLERDNAPELTPATFEPDPPGVRKEVP